MLDPSSPEFVAGRVVAVVALERLLRARTAFVVWVAAAVTGLIVVGAVVSEGVAAIVVGLLALVAASVTAALFVVRAGVLRALRRVGGGPHYARVRPIVERRMAELQRAGAVIPLDPPGVLRLAWRAKRPADLQRDVRETAATVARTIPDVVADVRREIEGSKPIAL